MVGGKIHTTKPKHNLALKKALFTGHKPPKSSASVVRICYDSPGGRDMWIKDLKDCPEFIAGDSAVLREILNPPKEPLKLRYSLAWAKVLPGKITRLHQLKTSEVYYILEGRGEMHIDEEQQEVRPGQAIYIPPNSRQRIKNIGPSDLTFLCIVDPAWRQEDEGILEEK